MASVALFLGGALASWVAQRWYQNRHPVAAPTSIYTSVNQGHWINLRSQCPTEALTILEAKWGDFDITHDLREFCADTDHVEFAAQESVLHVITNHRYLGAMQCPVTLWIKYY